VDDGQTISKIENGVADQVRPSEWQVRLYKNGAPTGGRDNWGLITGKTAASVMEQLKREQQFQIRFARFAGTDYRMEVCTHFNPLGPIAVVKQSKTRNPYAGGWDKGENPYALPLTKIREMQKAVETVNELREYGDLVKQIAESNERFPQTERGRTLREYLDNLKFVSQQGMKLNQALNDSIRSVESDILRGLEDVKRAEEKATALQPVVIQMLGDHKRPPHQGRWSVHYAVGNSFVDEEVWFEDGLVSKKRTSVTGTVTEKFYFRDITILDSPRRNLSGIWVVSFTKRDGMASPLASFLTEREALEFKQLLEGRIKE